MKTNYKYINKEVSWLSFNARVLQEASDPTVPLIDRLKFLGIYSNNLDEFFEVRVATLKRLAQLGKKSIKLIDENPKRILEDLQAKVLIQHQQVDNTYDVLMSELNKKDVYFINEKDLNSEQKSYVKKYFSETVRPNLFPIMIDVNFSHLPVLLDRAIYLIIRMFKKDDSKNPLYSIMEIPSKIIPRFVVLPKTDEKQYIMWLDDVIRFGLPDVFSVFDISHAEAFDLKVTRDAELDIDDDISTSYISKINKSIDKRRKGDPVRFGYDSNLPANMLNYIVKKLNLKDTDTIIPGGRYHNFKDFIKFPSIVCGCATPPLERIKHKDLHGKSSIFAVIREKDIMLHFPYHSFEYIIDFLREASIDPMVESIKITLYRLARVSSVVNALICARKNNKKVTVLLELQARFDEKANIAWANELKEEGVNVIFGIPGLKVHSKLCLITRKEGKSKQRHYCFVGTGNFNEDTSKVYTDHYLLTSHKNISEEVVELFDFFERTYKHPSHKHIILSPFNTKKKFTELINREIQNKIRGRKAYIYIKLNNIADREIIQLLYDASNAGVEIRIMARSMFSLVAGVKGMSENIQARCIVDKYLEHSRLLFFCNDDKELCYISSADWLPRNINSRIEVTCPVYDSSLKNELREIFNILWSDNVKSRILNEKLDNKYFKGDSDKSIRAQDAIYDYIKNKHGKCD